jgi:hypothetical protein
MAGKMLDKGENPRQENKERPYFIGSGDGTEGGEGGHHRRALVVGEDHPVTLRDALSSINIINTNRGSAAWCLFCHRKKFNKVQNQMVATVAAAASLQILYKIKLVSIKSGHEKTHRS